MVPSLKLNNGLEMPVVGLGTYKSEKGKVEQAVRDAIDAGYRHFDCAWFYGNEHEVGVALREKIKEGAVKREDLFITSKLWNNFHAKDRVVPMLKETLNSFKLDYIDLYLIHWPFGFKENASLWPISEGEAAFSDIDYLETWEGMEECVRQGLTKSIGVSNFSEEQIERILKNCQIKPVANQVEVNPNLNQKKLIQFCKERDIVITGYCPLGRSEYAGMPGFPDPTIFDPKVAEIGKKYNKTPAQVVLNYLISLGITVVPKSVTKSRIIENINVFDFKLDTEDVAYLDSCNKNQRVCPLSEIEKAVKLAIDSGYRHFDCAWIYGNEAEVGRAIKTKIKEKVIRRDEVFVTTKLWNNFHQRNKVVEMLQRSLVAMNLCYVDLYLIHWPIGFKETSKTLPLNEGKDAYSDVDYLETWQGMEDCVSSGYARSIGLANFNSEQIERVLKHAKFKPVILQIEVHPYFNQKRLIQFCKERDIIVTGYCPLGINELSGMPGFPERTILDAKIHQIAKKYNKTAAQVVLNYLVNTYLLCLLHICFCQVSLGVCVVTKSVTKVRIMEYINIFDFILNQEDVAYLDSCNKNQRICPFSAFTDHKYYPFTAKDE
ncbi:aldose reductase-like [Asbolus verrucosus]|uniref:Aldose reductase-like n=1 Tax=Asbolus verrucosus TaxID=1661398 RepID=A0A482W9V6_ASBVE|nr:aldose reductase-like [Asbolus verrucosus]